MTKSPNTRRLLLTAALGALLAVPTLATAQQRVGQDGHANDANNQLGSGGYNTPAARPPDLVNGYRNNNAYNNDVVFGNVSNGRAFTGSLPYSDPRLFQGNVAGSQVDTFTKNSTGVAQPYTGGARLPNQSTPFFGTTTTVAPPPGFSQSPNNQGFVPTPPAQHQDPADRRLNLPLDLTRPILPKPGELNLPGQLDPSAYPAPPSATMNPNTGVQSIVPNEIRDAVREQNGNTTTTGGILDPQTIQLMREELDPGLRLRMLQQQQNRNPANQNGPVIDPSITPPSAPDGSVSQAINPIPIAPTNLTVNTRVDNAINTAAVPGNIRVDQSTYTLLATIPTIQQSTQYAQMRAQLNQYYANRLESTDEAKNRVIVAELHRQADIAKKAALARANEGPPTPAAVPTTKPEGLAAFNLPDYARISHELVENALKNTNNAQPGVTKVDRPEPVQVESLATGVKGKGLAALLTKAEDMMRQGKFSSALNQYDAAEQVVPNNPMVLLGRANAELGAGYYAKAEQHLREAFDSDPTLMMAQYDLADMLGRERIQYLGRDLKDLAQSHQTLARPYFLLAYLAYNVHDEKQAAKFLDAAAQRAPGDEIVQTLKEHWKLSSAPSTQPAH